MRLGSQKLWSAALNMVKTLPELKSLLNLQLFCGKATATPSIHYFIFFPKQRGHTEAVLTVTVQAGGVQSRWYPGHLAFSLQISALNASCDMSMCISTAQARTKRWPREKKGEAPCKFPHKMLLLTCPCAVRLRRLAQNAGRGRSFRHFPFKFLDQ